MRNDGQLAALEADPDEQLECSPGVHDATYVTRTIEMQWEFSAVPLQVRGVQEDTRQSAP